MFCYIVLIVNIVFFIWCGILVHKIEKRPRISKVETICRWYERGYTSHKGSKILRKEI